MFFFRTETIKSHNYNGNFVFNLFDKLFFFLPVLAWWHIEEGIGGSIAFQSSEQNMWLWDRDLKGKDVAFVLCMNL